MPGKNVYVVVGGAGFGFEADQKRAFRFEFGFQGAQAAQMLAADTPGAFRFYGPAHIVHDEIDLVAGAGTPVGDIRFRLTIGPVGLQFHENELFEGRAELRCADPGRAAREIIGDAHIEQIELFGRGRKAYRPARPARRLA